MKTAKKTAEYTIFSRKDGRYAVKNAAKQWVNGEEKVAILQKEKLLSAPKAKPKAQEEAPEAEQQAAEENATEAEAEKAEEEGKATGE